MTTDAVGGVWSYAMELCRALPSIRFMLANMGPKLSLDQRSEAAELPNVEMREATFKLEWMENPWHDLQQAGKWLMGLENEFQPDLIHANGYVHAAMEWKVPVIVVAHSCVLSWWQAVKGGKPPKAWDRYSEEVEKGLRACQLVVAPSEAMAAAVADLYQIDLPRVIPNGKSRTGEPPKAVKAPVILSAGRLWDEAKNVGCLITATADLEWPLVLAGDAGEDEIPLANVRLLGRCDRSAMASWYDRATIYAHPARYEPFGMAPLEAALAGCALILADIPSLREVWGEAAEFVSPGDPAAWNATFRRLIEDPDAVQQLAAKGRLRAQIYTPGRMAAAYLTTYQEVLETRSSCVSSSL